MSEYSSTIKLLPKQIEWLKNVPKYRFSVLVGACQCGKSTLSALAMALLIEDSKPDENLFLAIGYSSSSVFNNIAKTNGYGIESFFGGRARVGKYQGNLALFIDIGGITKTLLFFGGANKVSSNLFHGFSPADIIVDEADRLSPECREEILQRVGAHPDAHVVYAYNATSPNCPFVTFVDDLKSKNLVNFARFSIWDNPALTKEQINKIIAPYRPDSVFYKKYVLGQDASADLAAFQLFDYNYIDKPRNNYFKYYTVVDVGQTRSATGMLWAGLYFENGIYKLDILAEYFWRNDDHPYAHKRFADTAADVATFVKLHFRESNHFPEAIIIDESDEFYRNIIDAFHDAQLPTASIKYPIKDEDSERVSRIDGLLYTNRLHIMQNCKHTITSIQGAEFDAKASSVGKIKLSDSYNDEGHSDLCDCLSYITKWIEPYLKK